MKSTTTAIDKHRLAGLQDGVYAIAMTLLVLELKLPPLGENVTDPMLWRALLSIWPKLLTWLLSFWVLAIFWMGDARALTSFTRVDGVLLRLSLWRLALVSLLPFSTALIGEHGHHTPAAAIYSAHLCLMAAGQTFRHLYLLKNPALVSWPDQTASTEARLEALTMLICTAAAFALAFVVPGRNMLALLPAFLLQRYRRGRRRVPSADAA